MAEDLTKQSVRLSPMMVAYVRELARLGAYGKGKGGVMRRFIEAGVQRALENKVIAPKSPDDVKPTANEDDEDDGT